MKKRFILSFQPENIDIPVTYNLIKKFDLKINILNAELSSGKSGHLVVDIDYDKEKIESAFEYFDEHKIECQELKKQLSFNANKCVSCGSCTAVCFSGALKINNPNWELEFDHNHCVVCGLCVKACPLQLFELKLNQYV